MSPRVRLLAVLGILLTLAAVGIMSCGKDKSSPAAPVPTVHKYPLGNGTWSCVATETPTAGTCFSADSWVDTVVVVGGVPDSGDPFAPAPFDVRGNAVTQTWADTMAIDSACSVRFHASGSGTIGTSSFTFTYNLSMTPLGNCSSSGITGACTGRLVFVCTRIATTPGLAGYPSGRTVSPARARWSGRLKTAFSR